MFFYKTPNCFFTCLYISIYRLKSLLLSSCVGASPPTPPPPSTLHSMAIYDSFPFLFHIPTVSILDVMRYYGKILLVCHQPSKLLSLSLPALAQHITCRRPCLSTYIYFRLITKWHSCEMFWIFNDNKTHFGCFHILLSNSSLNTISRFGILKQTVSNSFQDMDT